MAFQKAKSEFTSLCPMDVAVLRSGSILLLEMICSHSVPICNVFSMLCVFCCRVACISCALNFPCESLLIE